MLCPFCFGVGFDLLIHHLRWSAVTRSVTALPTLGKVGAWGAFKREEQAPPLRGYDEILFVVCTNQ